MGEEIINKVISTVVKCEYCKKTSLVLEEHIVWVNGNRVRKMFCDDDCRFKFQLGAED